MTGPLLIVTAVEAEAAAVRAGLDPTGRADAAATGRADAAAADRAAFAPTGLVGLATGRVRVEPVGVGPAAAAAGTARLLARAEAAGIPYRAVVSAGIAGGFTGRAPVGATVIGIRSIAADLGAETVNGFVPIDDLGFGTSTIEVDDALLKALTAAIPDAVAGDILTLSTVTGTAATAAGLAARFPAAAAEAMEGFGVAQAAGQAGIAFAELRTISNPIGPRDRAAWRIPAALAALTAAATTFRTLIP